jgi:hypothetical protein
MEAKVATQLAAYNYFTLVEKQLTAHHDLLEPVFF